MKKHMAYLYLTVIAVIFLIAGCGDLPVSPAPSTPPVFSSIPSAPEVQSTALESNTPVIISIDFASDELLSRYDSYIDESFDYEYSAKIIFTTNTAVRDFKYVEVNCEFKEDSTFVFSVGEILYSVDELLPEKPLVVSAFLPETIPTNGIVYTDENGEQRCFSIGQSGIDGSIFLNEF